MHKKSTGQTMEGGSLDHLQSEKIDRSIREQNRFLDFCASNIVEVTIFLQSGTQFIGIVRGHDRKSILLGGRSQAKEPRLIMKSYIALIRPNNPIELFAQYRGMGTALKRKKQMLLATRSKESTPVKVREERQKRAITIKRQPRSGRAVLS